MDKPFLSPCAFVSKQIFVQSFSCENEFDMLGNKLTGKLILISFVSHEVSLGSWHCVFVGLDHCRLKQGFVMLMS